MGTSDAQKRALALLPKFTGMTSVLCSLLIAYSILHDPKKRSRIHYRIIFGIAVVDMSNSFWHFLSTWPMPEDSGSMFAAGTETTCTLQGFFTQSSVAAPLYNAVLALYYLLVLRYGWTEDRVKPLEPFLHTFPLMFALSTAVMGISLKLYNPSGFWCWVAPYPGGCEGDDCIRGAHADMYRWTIYYGPLWTAVVFVTVAMFLVFSQVLRLSAMGLEAQEATLKAHTDLDATAGPTGEALLDSEPARFMELQEKRRRVRRDMAIQCLLYGGSFYIVWVWLTAVRILQAMKEPISYQLLATAAFMTPFQGFFNFLAFIFPRFFAAREANPEGGLIEWIKEAL